MNETLRLALVLVTGVLLGAMFFGGLWWTVRNAVSSQRPALWFFGSLLLRMSIAPGWILFCFRRSLGAAAGVSPWICDVTPYREAAHPPAGPNTATLQQRRPVMHLSPDEIIFWQHGFLKLNATIVFTWGLMLVLAVGSKLITRKFSTGLKRSRWQNLLEIVVTLIEKQIEEVGLRHPKKYLPLFGHALSVRRLGRSVHRLSRLRAADRLALYPPRHLRCACLWPCRCSASWNGAGATTSSPMCSRTFIMLPFNIISELSRTLALAVRLFGNMMSGAMIIGILLTITPFILSDRHEGARFAHRHGASLHLLYPIHGLHRGCHARA